MFKYILIIVFLISTLYAKMEAPHRESSLNSTYILKQLYLKYQEYVIAITLVVIFIIGTVIYLRYKLTVLLKDKTKELSKSYKLFDEYTIASRTDLSGKITYVTKAFCITSGYSQSELMGQNHRLLKESAALDKSYYKDMWMSIKSGHTWKGEFKNITKDGHRYWTKAVISPLFNSKSEIIGYEGVRHDITVKKILEEFNKQLEEEVLEKTQKLKKYAKYLDTLFDINPNITYVINNNKLERANKAFLKFANVNSVDEFLHIHKCVCELFTRDSHHPQEKHHISCNSASKITISKDEKNHLFILSTQNFKIDDETRSLITLEDITEIQKLAVTDKLTNLYNRVKIDEEIVENYKYFKQYQEVFSLILIDIDFFKAVNDTHGHLVGDEVLKDFAKIIKDSVRMTDIVGRWGGEEFIVICPYTNSDGAYGVASTIKSAIKNHIFSRDLVLTFSAGVCDINECKNIDSIIQATDKALYSAKDNGRNLVERYRC